MDAPAVAVTRDGKRLTTAWMDASGGDGNRNVLWSVGGSAQSVVHSDLKGEQGHPTVAVDNAGIFHLAWEDSRGGKSKIMYLSSMPKAKEQEISADGGTQPSIAAGKSVGLAWEQDGDIWFKLIR